MAKAKSKKKSTSSVPKALKGLTPKKRKQIRAWAASQCSAKARKKRK